MLNKSENYFCIFKSILYLNCFLIFLFREEKIIKNKK
jgi:hypothetical protein